ncbi:uncharacterized protein LOC128198522 [Bicyclus anynana]|uniref:Uncharacterized protein LOC128198389 n=1 Tax=Bicyclus anynana TaxID=110368 RepID=A0ABM3LKL7_BICAN|nr:uncharacterized protein LOC128198389 [Bicyclus anynana]XP_052739600.1 uncharacterized protein LOC128198389 [Bicyclus anynana]XP_052739601.1 uncharacterized protein LOC128198389 [Bicyclus anynana]XP_052739602.1 uncharacterized protein LOC128198389 [Bicyclus anynana]XP_052739603.1 uncharacterized protein LOC128198389 [Bicyclus anynana]XP_052740372.1 uncharacterized protein LOC128198522 [Bicyclus anynana]XP_052740373.1 uncharacterized protein LOC128198522 [Bicyclus anynana]XP_052740374.1 unc
MEGLLTILHQRKEKLRTLIENASTLMVTFEHTTTENLAAVIQEAEIIASRLQTLLTRLTAELIEYFRLSTEQATDDISEISTVQLEAEDVLCELNVRIKGKIKEKEQTTNINKEANPNARLPKLSLPEFDGDILNWATFWDQFSSNIDQRNIPEVDKLLYLKASLKNEASKLVEGLETTHRNYNIALATLKNRYGKENHVIDAHYAALYRIKASNDVNITRIRETFNNIERHLRVLHSLGEDIDHNHLRFLLMEKFPKEIIYEMKMKLANDSISEIRNCLEKIISAKEDALRISNNTSEESYTTQTLVANQFQSRERTYNYRDRNEVRDNQGDSNRRVYEMNRNNYNNNRMRYKRKLESSEKERNGKKPRSPCVFCKGAHFNDQCTAYPTAEDRQRRLKGRCYLCLMEGHTRQECKKKGYCVHCRTEDLHNRALCHKEFPSRMKRLNESSQNNADNTNVMSQINSTGTVFLQTAIVFLKTGGTSSRDIKCRVLLDSGSQRSYVRKSVIDKLKLPIEETNRLSVFTFGQKTPQEINSPLVRLELQTRTNKVLTIYTNVIPYITQNIPCPNIELGQRRDQFILADDGSLSTRVDILIGNNYYFNIINKDKEEIKPNLFLVDSHLGWIVSGEEDSSPRDELSAVTYLQACVDTRLHRPDPPLDKGDMNALWDLESLGITDSPRTSSEEEAIKNFNENMEVIDKRYTVSWPWIEYPPLLPKNYGLAVGRLTSLLKRLDLESLREYDNILKEQTNKGIIEILSHPTRKECHPIHYLPHHCIQQKGKPIRIVYDASAKIKDNKSLNECLYRGPLMLEDLTGLLIRFRVHTVALSADVEKAFLQVALHKKDRDVTRFLWLKDLTKPVTEDNIICMRFCRVPFGIISSPFLLNATIRYHLSRSTDTEIQDMAKNIYVDNLVTGTSSTSKALNLYKNLKVTFEQMSMNLRDWSSNSKEFMSSIHDKFTGKQIKILGLNWDLERDSLQLKFDVNTSADNKREVLKVIASIYDPCGYAAPYSLSAKLFFQELWKTKTKWDTKFTSQMAEEWLRVQKQLEVISKISIPRCYIASPKDHNYQLHCFTDASLKAYAAVVYIVNGKEKNYVMGKSRLVPIKDQDHLKIPRLELLGVLIGSRLVKFILKNLPIKITQQFLWTDSQIVIEWYKSSKLLTPFVSRRIQEIKSNKELIIKHVPSELNPADIATKSSDILENKRRWLEGPEFLTQVPQVWPQLAPTVTSLSLGEDLPNETMEEDIGTTEAGSMRCNEETEINDTDEKEQSKLGEIRKIQNLHFKNEIQGKETNLSRNLGLFLDIDGILRCRGRMKNTNWSFDKRYPILLPQDSDLTNTLITKTHNENYHVGANHTLSIIRESYWIPQGKRQVQKILRKCPICIKHGGGPYKLPPTPALPSERVNYSSPFTFTGLDYLGPVVVKNGMSTEKRWICLFTCLAIRAIHLEVVQDLTAEEGLRALRRMIASRGLPKVITSDNAVQFKLISEILTQPYCIENKIQWRFIPALTPWFGGFYERLVGIVKHCLKRSLQKHLLKDNEFNTIVREIEAVVNTRPLTCVDSEIEHILKPSDFLTSGNCISIEATETDSSIPGTSRKQDLIQCWKRALKIREEFKEMFSNRYLLSLRERYQHSHKEPRITSKLDPRVGQIVQIKGDSKNRESWKVGKIINLIKGKDDLSRVAQVKVGETVYTRSISHLYPLELDEEQTYITLEEPTSDNNITVSPEKSFQVSFERDTIEDVTETIQEVESNSSESIDKVILQNEELPTQAQQIEESAIESIPTNQSANIRPKRDAAARALQRIREWTQNLVTSFLAGSVVNDVTKINSNIEEAQRSSEDSTQNDRQSQQGCQV